MSEEQDHIRDLAEIRSMMERSTRFLSLSGWAGVMAGIYALAGAYVAREVYHFDPMVVSSGIPENLPQLCVLTIAVLALALGTAFFLSGRKAEGRGERAWNATSRRMLVQLCVPLITGAVLILILLQNGMTGLIAPLMLIFYGIAIFNASKFTYSEMRSMGLIEIGLGLAAAYFVNYGVILWTIGFGIIHIVYGIYLHYKYER